MPSHPISLATITTALGLLGLLGCWTGAESEGLPCVDNSHCGLGLDCIAGFCGGEPSDELCGNGYVDPNEACDEGSLNAANGACRLDCTPESCGDGVQGPTEACDLGEQNDNLGTCTLECTLETCGDDNLGPTEVCDDGNTISGDGCSSECTLESCGNGVVDQGEACDDIGESATCDDDCTVVECGDLEVNAEAGEECDNDSPVSDDLLCLSNCTIPLLWDDMEPGTPAVAWSHTKLSGDAEVMDTWTVSSRNAAGDSMRAWDSGLPAASSGDTRLTTPVLDLGSLTGEGVELRFDHARRFRDCADPDISYEGAVVEVSVDGAPFQVIVPADGYGTTPIGDGACALNPKGPNPLDGQDGFTLDVDYTTETFDLSAFAGSSIEIGFRVGWDCGNCPDNQGERGWFIDNVIVGRE